MKKSKSLFKKIIVSTIIINVLFIIPAYAAGAAVDPMAILIAWLSEWVGKIGKGIVFISGIMCVLAWNKNDSHQWETGIKALATGGMLLGFDVFMSKFM